MNVSAATNHLSSVQAWARMAVFIMKVFPMLPSRPVDWITKKPVVEKVTFPILHGEATADLYRHPGNGRHPGIVVCLGVVPFGTDHPQVPRLGEALARAGFTTLLYWSPVMRDLRLAPDDAENIAMAYDWLIRQPYIDPDHSGLLGTCVGGSFALMAAASPRIRDKVSFIAAYAPYFSLITLLQDVASSTTVNNEIREPWDVDQLTRNVLVRSMTDDLEPNESEILRKAFAAPEYTPDIGKLSVDGKTICSLLSHPNAEEAQKLILQLPEAVTNRLKAMSPVQYVKDIHTTNLILLHDTGDTVIPVGESRRLRSNLPDHINLRYREMNFQHLDPSRLPKLRLIIELVRFFETLYPLFNKENKTRTSCKPRKHAGPDKNRPAAFFTQQ